MLYLDSNMDWNFWFEFLFGGWNWLISIPVGLIGLLIFISIIVDGCKDTSSGDIGIPGLPF